MINEIEYKIIVKDNNHFLENIEFKGFKEDYFVIQSLVSDWKPNHIFEIGTCTGNGTRLINHASPNSKITTIDIVPNRGEMCPSSVVKLCGDSMNFNFEEHYPIDCWFIDGAHTYENVYKETTEAIKSEAKYIIYHDADLDQVVNGLIDSFKFNKKINDYDLYRVINPPFIYSSTGKNITRVLYAIKKN